MLEPHYAPCIVSVHYLTPSVQHARARRWQRFKLDLPVCVIVQREGKTLLIRGRGRDISEGGMGVFAGVEARVDAEVDIEFTPAFNGPPVRVRGVVRNRRGYVYGVEFLSRTPQEEQNVSLLKMLLFSTAASTI
jgi:hypothetical protein